MTNVAQHFAIAFNGTCEVAADDMAAMQSMPLNSTCGDDCRAVIDTGAAFARTLGDVALADNMLARYAARQCSILIDG